MSVSLTGPDEESSGKCTHVDDGLDLAQNRGDGLANDGDDGE